MKFGLVLAGALAALLAGAADRVRVEEGKDHRFRFYSADSETPFAETIEPVAKDIRFQVRTAPDSPFVFIDFAPAGSPAPRLVTRADLPRMRLLPFAEKPVTQGSGGLLGVTENPGSYAYLAVAEPKTRRGVVAGWVTNVRGSGVIRSSFDAEGRVVLAPFEEYGRMMVKPLSERPTDVFAIGFFNDCRRGLESYADAVAQRFEIRLPPQISGYTTWYADQFGYSDRKHDKEGCGAGTAESTRAFADAVQRLNLVDFGFTFFQMDDYWQDGRRDLNGPARIFTRVRNPGPYANGFRPTTDYLRAKHIRSGLWFMPFGGISNEPWWADKSNLYARAHHDFKPAPKGTKGVASAALPQKAGAPFETVWGGTCLDMTKREARAYLADLVQRFTYDWGFSYLKFDGMWTGHPSDLGGGATWTKDNLDNVILENDELSPIEAFRFGCQTMRDAAAPGTFLLACNVAQSARGIAASYGLVDAMRIGGDNGPVDMFPARYMKGVDTGTPRYFLNGRVWYNDPDPVYVRDAVSLGRARLFASWASLGGMLFNFSDYLPALSEERVEILRRTLAPHNVRNVRPVDYFERLHANAWCLESDAWKIFGFYNFDPGKPLEINYPAAYAGLDPAKQYVGFDFWNNRFVPPFDAGDGLRADVMPDDCRVWSLVEVSDRPALVSTSRHVASPAFEVSDLAWREPFCWLGHYALSGTSRVIASDRYEMRFFVPEGWAATEWSVDGGAHFFPAKQQGPFLRIFFTPPKTESISWILRFTKK